MSSVQHGLKKRLSRAKLSRRTIDTRVGAEYANEKNALIRARNTLKEVVKYVEADRLAFHAALKAEKSFCEAVFAEAKSDGEVAKTCAAGLTDLRGLQANLVQRKDEKYGKLMNKVKDYLVSIEEVMKAFKAVEQNYSEVARYEKKVEKLMKGKKEDKTERNLGKLKVAREGYDKVLGGVIDRVKKVNEEFEEVLMSATCAFWRRNDAVLEDFGKGSLLMREWSKDVVGRLVGQSTGTQEGQTQV